METAGITPELLKFFPLLNTLPAQDLQKVAEVAQFLTVNRRGVIYEARTATKAVYFLFEGRLQGTDFTIDGREVGLFFAEPKDYCGELGLFDHGDHAETLIATVKSRIVSIPVDDLRAILFRNPIALADACQRIAYRVRALTEQRSLLTIPDIPQRVCAQLLQLARIQTSDDQMYVSSAPTHQELAIMLNTSRETVTRIFQRLQSQGLVRREESQSLLICDPDSLSAIAEGKEKL